MPRAYQVAAARIVSVIQPSVPEWTWVRIWLWSNSTASLPFRIPMTIVTRKTAIAVRYKPRTRRGQSADASVDILTSQCR
jgi:hypothetical protein